VNQVVVALGSNIEPDIYIPRAINFLSREWQCLKESSLVVTSPLGIRDQPDFTNGVVLLATPLEKRSFKARLKEIEVLLGRQKRTEKWGPREIDLDVLIWNGEVVNKDYKDRAFLRKAVTQVLPAFSR
jgi:2-amino-4-hydroxy-6-hydroxymethyldihydropteridine diphosphokinase